MAEAVEEHLMNVMTYYDSTKVTYERRLAIVDCSLLAMRMAIG